MSAQLPAPTLDLALLAGLLAVAVVGPDRPSLDHSLDVERLVPDLATPATDPASEPVWPTTEDAACRPGSRCPRP